LLDIEHEVIFSHPLFHGIFAIKIARPQYPLSPENINPAPKNPESRKKLGLSKYPNALPTKTP